ncbi:MAG: hypothetical protein AAFY99_13235 [Pseudomonadota bacterium]
MGRSDPTKRHLRLASAARILQLKAKVARSELGQALQEEAQLKSRIDQCVTYMTRTDDLALAMQPVIATEYSALLGQLAETSTRVANLRNVSSQHKRRSDKVDDKLDEAKALASRQHEENLGNQTIIDHHMRRKPRTS